MRVVLCGLTALCVVSTSACNKRVFFLAESSCDRTIPVDVVIPTQRDADILIVVDNSGSMQEEQDELVDNFVNANCPLPESGEIPERFKNPAPSLYAPGGELAECGFIQLLAAFENNFRVGVITTDVGLIDNRANFTAGACSNGACAYTGEACNQSTPCPDVWGRHPQRGCLQPDYDGNKIIAKTDQSDALRSEFGRRFGETLDQIRTFGSPVERGLDAAAIFLDANAQRGEGCDDDLANFRRPGAQLVVIFLTDEQDCSHALGDPAFEEELADELAGTPPQNDPDYVAATYTIGPACYDRVNDLSGVGLYKDAIDAVDPNAKIALIGGVLPSPEAQDGFDAASCLLDDDTGVPVSDCWPSRGASNLADKCSASPTNAEAREERRCTVANGVASDCQLECCVADAGTRYLDFARQFVGDSGKRYLLDSICNRSFRDTMLKVAAFIAATNFIDLVEAPVEGLIAVEKNDVPVARIEADACNDSDGWYLEGDRRIVFCGAALPGPADRISVRAKAASTSAECVPDDEESGE